MTVSVEVKRRAEARVGTTIKGKYRVEAVLGIGGMGAVFSATHRNGTRVALKVLHSELSRMEDVKTRFLREGYTANRVGHAGVAKVIDDDIADTGEAFLVMELLEGETLEARWETAGKKLPLGEVATHVDRLLDVLAAAHDSGVIHRDVKPENVFLTRAGELKVLDFGIARLLDGTGATRSGELMGTPAFMAPEQANGMTREVNGQSDVWAVGAMMFTLVSGREVHEAKSGVEQMVYAATKRAPPVSQRAGDLPRDVAGVIDVALAFDKAERWMSARAMQAALRNAMSAVDLGTSPTIRPHAPPGFSAAVSAMISAPTVIMGSMAAHSAKAKSEPKK